MTLSQRFGGILESITPAQNHSLIWGFAKKISSQALFELWFFFCLKGNRKQRKSTGLLLSKMSKWNGKLRNEGRKRIDFGHQTRAGFTAFGPNPACAYHAKSVSVFGGIIEYLATVRNHSFIWGFTNQIFFSNRCLCCVCF